VLAIASAIGHPLMTAESGRSKVRGVPERQLQMLAMVNLEDFVPADHPIRRIRTVVEAVLAELDGELSA
jgi:hypothetical protein